MNAGSLQNDTAREPSVRCTEQGSIWILTIDNPRRANALTASMSESLLALLNKAERTKHVRCVVITGAGSKAFSSGHDLTEKDWQRRLPSAAGDMNSAFVLPASMTKPTIAAVNGAAYAAGFILALSCDIRVASANASFCASGARIGLLPVAGQISRLPCLLPYGKVLELLMTAEPMTAEEALAHGFVNRLVREGEELKEALRLASAIAGNSQAVVREIKRGINIMMSRGCESAREFEYTIGQKLKEGPDHKEGVQAFLEKRPPEFSDIAGD